MNHTRLNDLLEKYLQFAEISGNKYMGYFYEKENFMATQY